MIKNIIFDLSEVIISGYYGIENMLDEEYGIPKEEFFERKKSTLDYFLDTMRGKHTEEEYYAYLLKDVNWNITLQEFKSIARKNLNIPVKGTIEIIKKLRKNYKLILLTDHIKGWMEYIKEHNKDLNLFDYHFYSYDLGYLKSDENSFKNILNVLSINPQETLFIDDSKINITSAQKYGIDGIVFKNAQDLEKELKKRNITF